MNYGVNYPGPTIIDSGFTLLEMLVVLAIIGVMLAIVPPMLGNSINHSRIKTATRELAAGLKLARYKAINMHVDTTLVLDTDSGDYKVAGMDKRLSLPKGSNLLLTTARSEQLSKHSGAIRFFTDGSSTGGQIKLSLKDSYEYLVNVNWLTGKVTITP